MYPHVSDDVLASVFGRGIMANFARNRADEEAERAIAEHLKTHTIVDWCSKFTEMKTLLRRAAIVCNSYDNDPALAVEIKICLGE